jgi:hypothetical protein
VGHNHIGLARRRQRILVTLARDLGHVAQHSLTAATAVENVAQFLLIVERDIGPHGVERQPFRLHFGLVQGAGADDHTVPARAHFQAERDIRMDIAVGSERGEQNPRQTYWTPGNCRKMR